MDKMLDLNPIILTTIFKVNRLTISCKRQKLSNFRGKVSRPSCMLFTRNFLNVDIQVESKWMEKDISGKK